MKLKHLVLAMAAITSPLASAFQTEDTRILSFPDIHKEHVTFVYAVFLTTRFTLLSILQ